MKLSYSSLVCLATLFVIKKGTVGNFQKENKQIVYVGFNIITRRKFIQMYIYFPSEMCICVF